MQPPRNLKELRSLQGRLAYIWRFISNLLGHCQPFTKLMKKGASFFWNNAYQKSIRRDHRVSHIPTRSGSSSIRKTFLAIYSSNGSFLGIFTSPKQYQNQEQVIYYLNRTMIRAEHCYNPIEKECLALVFYPEDVTLPHGAMTPSHLQS